MSTVTPNSHLLIVSQGGYGKSTPLASYPRHSRGGQGVRTFRTSEKAGKVAAARVVSDGPDQLILIISAKAQVVRITLEDVRVTGRNTQGVIVWRDREPDDYVASIAVFQESDTHSTKEDDTNGKKSARSRGKSSKIEENELDVDENGEIQINNQHTTGDSNESGTGERSEVEGIDEETNEL